MSNQTWESGGLLLRDYFAAAALASTYTEIEDGIPTDPSQIAKLAYEIADAMLAAREAK